MTDTNYTYWNRMVPEITVTDFSVSLHFYSDVPEKQRCDRSVKLLFV
ncbi:hypothetical protein KLPP_32170 [Klebsiella pneumoniae subsp. pneumoniae]|nr:hypothetical protein KLPP_32170 [Klebsiella pneumoniae subsp. pneumoniae]